MKLLKKALQAHEGQDNTKAHTLIPLSLETSLVKILFNFEYLLKAKKIGYEDLKNKKGRYGYFVVPVTFLESRFINKRVLLKNIKILRTYQDKQCWIVFFKFRLFSKYYFKLKKVDLKSIPEVIFNLYCYHKFNPKIFLYLFPNRFKSRICEKIIIKKLNINYNKIRSYETKINT
jgi:hypothetical protein